MAGNTSDTFENQNHSKQQPTKRGPLEIFRRILKSPVRRRGVEAGRAGMASSERKQPVYTPADEGFSLPDGTMITTTTGQSAVEILKAGDIVVTASGARRVITKLDYRDLDFSVADGDDSLRPYSVRKGAFGPDKPSRDLSLSPDALVGVVCLSQVMIPVKHLENGATVAQPALAHARYWRLILEQQDMLLAENLPVASALDIAPPPPAGPRSGLRLVKEAGPPKLCRPLITHGMVIDAIRVQLIGRARELGWRFTQEADLKAIGGGRSLPGRWLSDTVIRFSFSASIGDIALVSRSFVPRHADVETFDERRLGVPVRGLTVADSHGALVQVIGLDHPGLADGFHPVQEWEGDRWRWTNGHAVLSASLWKGGRGTITLDLETAPERGTLRAWLEPSEE